MNNCYHLEGTIRAEPAHKTLMQAKKLMKALGITRLANITLLDNIGIPVYLCYRPQSKHLAVSQGKGLTHDLAKISALMESVETYAMENPPQPLKFAAWRDLPEQQRYPLETLLLPSVTADYSKQQSMGWNQIRSIDETQTRWIPQAMLDIRSGCFIPERTFLNTSTNGIAAGNTYEEAISHGLYELIERDALVKFQHDTQQEKNNRLVKLQTLPDNMQHLHEKIIHANASLVLWDITHHLEVPSFHAVIYNHDINRPLTAYSGTGTHLDSAIAVSRAITEAIQARAAIISGSRDDIFTAFYQQSRFNQLIPQQTKHQHQPFTKKVTSAKNFADVIKTLSTLLHSKTGSLPFYIKYPIMEKYQVYVAKTFHPTLHFQGTRL